MRRREFMTIGPVGLAGLGLGSMSLAPPLLEHAQEVPMGIRFKLTSVVVRDQAEALAFYTDVMGFVKKEDIPVGEDRWLTVVSPEEPDGTELLLEPGSSEIASTFQKALYEAGLPANMFAVDDIQAEYDRLVAAGVTFTSEPIDAGGTKFATFEDTCGNYIRLYQS